ncbi:hypothetical protein BOX15_Mlig016573g1, partial [Macrostomum lignano]
AAAATASVAGSAVAACLDAAVPASAGCLRRPFRASPVLSRVARPHDRIRQHVQPLQPLPYTAQLELKHRRVAALIGRLTNCLRSGEAEGGSRAEALCPVPPVLHPPGRGWWRRNRNSASVLFDPDGWPLVGHSMQVRMFEPGFPHRRVGFSVEHLASTCPIHARVFQLFTDFLRSGQSQFDPYDKHRKPDGAWAGLVARTNHDDELMLEVCYHAQLPAGAEARLLSELTRQFFPAVLRSGLNLVSGYSQASSNCFQPVEPRHLFGRDSLHQRLLDRRFKVRPHSFFQNNTVAAETLYGYLRQLLAAELPPSSPPRRRLLIDAFCGTGVVGQVLFDSRQFDQLIGFDSNQSAVRDALDNARLNGLPSNAFQYHCEDAATFFANRLSAIDSCFSADSVCCVLNPARDGLDDASVSAIRACPTVDRIVYISCRPEGQPTDNFLRLLMPEGSGRPFRLASCQPIDLFPNCRHVELVLDFVR